MKLAIKLIVPLCLVLLINYTTEKAIENPPILYGIKELSKIDKQRILDQHNKWREYIASGENCQQPSAENIIELTWDDYAADLAFLWAGNCTFEHNSPKDINNNPMGQNLAIYKFTKEMSLNTAFDEWIDKLIKLWYDEVNDYKYGDKFSKSTGHYTQLMWAHTAKVGCGFSYFEKAGWYCYYLVCNYAPAGNYVGEKPYIVGEVNCEKHNLNKSNNYKHLCVKK